MTDNDIGDQQRLKAKLARKRGKRSIEAPIWEKATKQPDFPAALGGDHAAEKRISNFLSGEYFLARKQRRGDTAKQRRKDDSLIPAEERRRGEVIGRQYARLARRIGEEDILDESTGVRLVSKPKVQKFRDDFLGGRPVSRQACLDILRSPAAALLHASFFREKYMLRRHTSVLLNKNFRLNRDGNRIDDYEIEIDSDGIGKTIETNSIDARAVTKRLWFQLSEEPENLIVVTGSVFDELRELSEFFAGRFGWDLAESTMFVMTDASPSTPCFLIEAKPNEHLDHVHPRLVMTIQPWVTTKTVAAVYKAMQRMLMNALRRDPDGTSQLHPTKIPQLEFYDFVAERRDSGMTWREAMNAWNKSRPKAERYSTSGEQNFSRDFKVISARLMHLYWEKRETPKRRSPQRRK